MTGDRHASQAVAAIGAVELRPPDAFLWFGRREVVHLDAGGELLERLVQRLHNDFFSTGEPVARRSAALDRPDDGGAFAGALSQANGGRGAWDGGWRIAASDAEDGLGVARSDGLVLFAPAAHVRADREATEGTGVSVLLPKELRGFSPGFYVALGDRGSPAGNDAVGLYWNIAAAGAVTLVARLTYALNGAGLAFSLELPDTPERYGVGDAAVLQVARADAPAAIKLARPLLRTLGAHLAAPAPAFTKPLARGLAVAEQPADGQRFGEHRCRLLAEALVAAAEAGARTVDARREAVREHFAASGIRLDAPYLQPGSADAYA